jgi:F-type H+-transporting ATPase subunit b
MDAGLLSKIGFDLEVAVANLVNFLIIFLLFKIFFFKPIQTMIDTRKAKIQKGLEQAVEAEQALKSAEENASTIVRDARKKASVILSDAQSHATKLKDQGVIDGQAERTRILARAEQEIAQDRRRMEEDVEKEMTNLVGSLTEKAIAEK